MTSTLTLPSSNPPHAEWLFPVAAALGSSVRAHGIEREIWARLSFPDRKHLSVEDGVIRLCFEWGQDARLEAAVRIVDAALAAIAALPVLPSEVEDILQISPRERLKWVKDGRLQSAGTRTVKLRGRAKAVTFHVFAPETVIDALDRDLPALWREADAEAKTEARQRAAGKAARTRAGKSARKGGQDDKAGSTVTRRRATADRASKPRLKGWDAFHADGLLR